MIETILFDVDGVMLSEEGYFDASALTVWEMLTGPDCLGRPVAGIPPYTPEPDAATIRSIRSLVFDDDRVLDFMKSRGINANWDMVYLQFSCQLLLILEQIETSRVDDLIRQGQVPVSWSRPAIQALGAALPPIQEYAFASFTERFAGCANKADLFAALSEGFKRYTPSNQDMDAHSLWEVGRQVFQSWYLGDDYFDGPPSGKRGFLASEVPLIDAVGFRRMLDQFLQQGVRLGIATGRPKIETYVPLEQLGWLSAFDNRSITTASDVVAAESRHPNQRPLSKPNPFCYLRSELQSPEDDEVLALTVPVAPDLGSKVLVVGDSIADWMAARKAGFRFAAVLTGLTGQAARQKFEELGCDWILNDVSELQSALSQG